MITSLANSYRESIPDMLEEYLVNLGDKEVLQKYWEKKAQDLETKGECHRRTKAAKFKLPSGNWEEEVVGIDGCERFEGNIIIYLSWKDGRKSQHPLVQVNERCPQKVNVSDASKSSKLISIRC